MKPLHLKPDTSTMIRLHPRQMRRLKASAWLLADILYAAAFGALCVALAWVAMAM